MTQAEKIDKIAEQVSEIHGDMKVLKDSCERHDKTLYGNGRPGIVSRFDAVEEQQRKCPALQEKLLGNRLMNRGNWIQIAMVIAAVAAVVVAILK